MALIIPSNYHKISDVEKNHISWIEPELAKRQDIRPLRIGILNIMPLGKQYEFNLLHPLGLSPFSLSLSISLIILCTVYSGWPKCISCF
ncbi:homoserine O-succinyltransferase [Prochlorococcus sp. AH-716-M06]|nr:homoserine O-succinyltransferase [Prochlorococcus sp. AH-716-M06]